MSTSRNKPDVDELQNIFQAMAICQGKISKGESNCEADLLVLLEKLTNISDTADIASSLATALFLNVGGNYDALDIIKYLGYAKPDTYVVPFSLAIRDSALKLLRPSPSLERVIHFIPSNDFLKMLVHQLSSDSVQVSDCAHSIVLQLGRYCEAEENVSWMNVCKVILTEITSLWSNIRQVTSDKTFTSTLRVRYANTVTALACVGKYDDEEVENLIVIALNKLLVDGVFDDNQDILLQISIFDLISNNIVSQSDTQISYLVIEWLSNTFSKRLYQILKDDDYMMKSDALRLYTYIAVLWKQQNSGTNNNCDFESIIFKNGPHGLIHSFANECSGELDRLALVDMISTLAKSEWVELVCQDEVLSTAWLRIDNVAQPKLKGAILNSIGQVIEYAITSNKVENSEPLISVETRCSLIIDAFAKVNQKNHILNGGLDLILNAAKSSFVETRLGSYELLRVIGTYQARRLLIHGDCVDFLLSQDGESTKEGKEAKYEIIRALHSEKNKQAMNIMLSDHIIRKFELLMKNGPHSSPSIPWQLATQ